MAFISWSDELRVGNEDIDNQHKQFVVLINQMHEAMKKGDSGTVLPDILKQLGDYTIFHFTSEERFMNEIGFPGVSSHKQIHTLFAADVKQTIKDFTDGKILLSLKVMNSLKDWLITHIMVEDKKYSAHYQKIKKR